MANSIKVGDSLPDVTLRVMTSDGPAAVQTGEWFAGKKVVLFAVPGAFTPTCSNDHLPSFLGNATAIHAKGVDAIACVAVNDVFVLDAWNKANDVGDRITLLSDGNAEFTEAIGMTLDGSGIGLGKRSLRYAMLVDDGVVKAMEVEENPGVCTVSGGKSFIDSL